MAFGVVLDSSPESSLALTLQVVMAVGAGIGAQLLADGLRIPSIVLLLGFGIALGPDGFGLLQPQSLGVGLEVIISLAVALILFEGGLNLRLADLGTVSGAMRNLVSLGVLVTLVGGGVAAHYLGEFPWPLAFLYAALVTVTGPTVIGPLLRQVPVDRQVAALLEGEGVLNDPVGAVLAVVVLNVVLTGDTGLMDVGAGLLQRLGVGAAIGALGGWSLGFLFRSERFPPQDLKNLAALAGLWGLYSVAQTVQSESGLMAAVVAGLVLQRSAGPEQRLLKRFKGQLTTLAVSLLFVLLAADLSIDSVLALGWGGLLTVLALMLLVRPVNILLSTWNTDLSWQQKVFLAWVAPRGIVSASVASLFSILLTAGGVTGGDSVKGLVFLTITLTVVLQGLTAGRVARLLGICSSQTPGAVIVGSNPLGRLVARVFQEHGEPVTLVDTNLEDCGRATQENLRVVVGSALDAQVLEEAGVAEVGTFLAATQNPAVNGVLAQRVAEEFYPPRVLVALAPDPGTTSQVQSAFGEGTVKTWNQWLETDQVRLLETTLTLEDSSYWTNVVQNTEVLPLALHRQGQVLLVTPSMDWQPGDRLLYLVHIPYPQRRPAEAPLTFEPVPLENLAATLLPQG
ncbi:MAG: cation:proton antiporter [Gloeomargaritaceae cyanobacterium C42_A2020_066]|nr:cation:proton antiporter [Gloeomargaritaceae cyanobacterium C42_A2020_066]